MSGQTNLHAHIKPCSYSKHSSLLIKTEWLTYDGQNVSMSSFRTIPSLFNPKLSEQRLAYCKKTRI